MTVLHTSKDSDFRIFLRFALFFRLLDIIHGKLDQKNKQLEVDYAIGRDIRPEDISKISSTLQEWCDSCESVLHTIENQIDRANLAKATRLKHTEDLEGEVWILDIRENQQND